MRNSVPAADIMTRNIVSLKLSDKLSTAEALFKKNHIRHLPVVKENHIVGLISYNDLLRISFADAADVEGGDIETTVYDMFTIEQVMTKKVVTVTPRTSVGEVASLFLKHEFHALPVVEDNKLVGIVTTTDVIRYFLDET